MSTEVLCGCGHTLDFHPLEGCEGTGAQLDPMYGIPPEEPCACKEWEPEEHDHLANVAWAILPTLGRTPLCGDCGLVLERSGDALVVPGEPICPLCSAGDVQTWAEDGESAEADWWECGTCREGGRILPNGTLLIEALP